MTEQTETKRKAKLSDSFGGTVEKDEFDAGHITCIQSGDHCVESSTEYGSDSSVPK